MPDTARQVRRTCAAFALFAVSVTVLAGLAYGASFVVRPARGCEAGCWNASPAMPTLYLGPADSGRTVQVTEGQVLEVDRRPGRESIAMYSDDSNALTRVEAVPGSNSERFLANGPGTARLVAVVRDPPSCTPAQVACPAAPLGPIAQPPSEVTVIVG